MFTPEHEYALLQEFKRFGGITLKSVDYAVKIVRVDDGEGYYVITINAETDHEVRSFYGSSDEEAFAHAVELLERLQIGKETPGE